MDILHLALESVAQQSAAALGFCFTAGLMTSLGPCVAPRLIAAASIAASTSGWRRRILLQISLAAGLCVGYLLVGVCADLLASLVSNVSVIYAVLAAALFIAGVRTIVTANGHGGCITMPSQRFATPTFLFGVSFALVLSPCCTPIIAAIAQIAHFSGDWVFTSACIVSFACGHAVPMLCTGTCGIALRSSLVRFESACSIVAGSLLVGMAAYYVVQI